MSTIHPSPSLFPSLPLSVSQSLDELKIDTLKDVFHKITSIRNFTGIRNRTPESIYQKHLDEAYEKIHGVNWSSS